MERKGPSGADFCRRRVDNIARPVSPIGEAIDSVTKLYSSAFPIRAPMDQPPARGMAGSPRPMSRQYLECSRAGPGGCIGRTLPGNAVLGRPGPFHPLRSRARWRRCALPGSRRPETAGDISLLRRLADVLFGFTEVGIHLFELLYWLAFSAFAHRRASPLLHNPLGGAPGAGVHRGRLLPPRRHARSHAGRDPRRVPTPRGVVADRPSAARRRSEGLQTICGSRPGGGRRGHAEASLLFDHSGVPWLRSAAVATARRCDRRHPTLPDCLRQFTWRFRC